MRILLQGRQNKSLKYVTTHLSYVVRENNEDLTKLGCDRKSRSRQEVILVPREGCCDKRQDAEREKKLQRKLLRQEKVAEIEKETKASGRDKKAF